MRNGERSLDVVSHGLARGVGKIIERQDQHMIAGADASALAPPTIEAQAGLRLAAIAPGLVCHRSHQRLVLRFCTCTWVPAPASAIILPMSSPYLMTVSPFLRAFSAT